MKRGGINLKISSRRHVQTNSASEIMTKMVENYIRCYISYDEDDWEELLPAVELDFISSNLVSVRAWKNLK